MDYRITLSFLGIALTFHAISVAKCLPFTENVSENLLSDHPNVGGSEPLVERHLNVAKNPFVDVFPVDNPTNDEENTKDTSVSETQSSDSSQSNVKPEAGNNTQRIAEAQHNDNSQQSAEIQAINDNGPTVETQFSDDVLTNTAAQRSDNSQLSTEIQAISDNESTVETQFNDDVLTNTEAQSGNDMASTSNINAELNDVSDLMTEAQDNANIQTTTEVKELSLESIVDTENRPFVVEHEGVALRYVVGSGIQKFTHEFFKKTAATRNRNLVCSPVSANVLLSMVAHGARGHTAFELQNSLHSPSDRVISQQGYRSLIDSFNEVTKSKLHLSGKVWINGKFHVEKNFEDLTGNYFRTPTEKLDFHHPALAAEMINEWVQDVTDNKIKTVVKPEDVYEASMVLTNVVYFKGYWANKFDEVNTSNKPFSIDKKSYKIVPTMYQKNIFNYGYLPELNAAYIELPYDHVDKNDSMSMFIIVPTEINGLKKAINYSDKIDYEQLHNNPKLTPVNLYLPKFKVRTTLNLETVLMKMGMQNMFQSTADFSGISQDGHLKINRIIQKAIIDVNEEGSESSAVTAATSNRNLGKKVKAVELHVDRPFIYVIHHHATNTNLYQGYVRVPTTQ